MRLKYRHYYLQFDSLMSAASNLYQQCFLTLLNIIIYSNLTFKKLQISNHKGVY